MTDYEEKTRVTQVVQELPNELRPAGNDCLVIIYSKEPTLLGKRFVLERTPMRVGRGTDNHIVLEGDSVSRRHAFFERQGNRWLVVDDDSTNGTYRNEDAIRREVLENGDRIKIGPTILKYLSGADAEAKYHEEIYKMTIIDGLTQVHNKRYLYEALERELVRARRHERPLSLAIFDIDFFKRINDQYGHLAGDHVLRELARLVQNRIRRDEIIARYGGEEFVLVLPETALDGAISLSETICRMVSEHRFEFQGERIPTTISVGCAQLEASDQSVNDLIQRADEKLYVAKRNGRNQVRY